MTDPKNIAPGSPGIPPRWTTSAKDGVGTSLSTASRVWFTHSHGILNEVYSPRIDQACIRDLGLIVADGRDFFSEEKRHTNTEIERLAAGVPAYRLINRCRQGRYVIEKEVFTDPTRDVVLQRIVFQESSPSTLPYRLYALLAPHLRNHGSDNTAWVGEYKGQPLLLAKRDGTALALACSTGWLNRSVGYVGYSDGWQDLSRNKKMTWFHERAEAGNVALTGELPLVGDTPCVLALGFGRNSSEAALRAISSLEDDYEELRRQYVEEWTEWLDKQTPLHEVCPIDDREACVDRFRVSATVIRTHEAKEFPGGIIASLSIPWGYSKGDNDLGGYHLTWPRDLAETASSLIALGAFDDAKRVLHFLQSTQEPDGHWAQNMWLDGRPYWNGTQMDETALPILLVDLARREGAIDHHELTRLWPMVRSAASFLVCNGPVTQQDRWEEDPGYSAFTLAAEISALLAAADLADAIDAGGIDTDADRNCSSYLRETADSWHSRIDDWIYATDTELAHQAGVDGYYVRIAPPETSDAPSPIEGFVAIKNRPPDQTDHHAANIVSPDALALVRFGLRAANDPRIANTVKVIDRLLRVELPQGPCWYRYNDDGYGEQEDGGPFNGTGIGRVWPLLTGERAHYELAAGNRLEAEQLLEAFTRFAGDSGLLPEQVWDSEDVPRHELFRGRPTGSAMPLVWSHAEYVKLLRSLRDGQVFDMPPQGVQRYLVDEIESPHHTWRFNHKCRVLPRGKVLRLEAQEPAIVHWSAHGKKVQSPTVDSGLGIHFVDLPTDDLPVGDQVDFRWLWTAGDQWDDEEYSVEVA